MWEEFKKFAFKGNVIDMAVGVIIGSAFSAIVTALVNSVLMPLISLLTGKVNLVDLKWVLREAVMEGEEILSAEVAVAYGAFLQAVLNFFLIAITLFIFIKLFTNAGEKLRRKKEEEEAAAAAAEPAAPAAPTEAELLTEIRDLLKEKAAEKSA